MSKEYLEAWNFIKDQMPYFTHSHLVTEMRENSDIVEQALQRLEAIDNTKPSEALDGLEKIIHNFDEEHYDKESIEERIYIENHFKDRFEEELDTIKNYILKTQEQDFNYNKIVIPFLNELAIILGINDIDEMLDKIKEQEKVLKIIKERQVNIALLITVDNVEEYNFYIPYVEHEKYLTQEEFELLKRWLKC